MNDQSLLALLVHLSVVAYLLPACGDGQSGNLGFEQTALSGDAELVALRARVNEKFVVAETGGAQPLIANRLSVGSWEKFYLHDLGNGHVALRSANNGKYVTAENAGSSPLIANRDSVGSWETFELLTNSDGTTSFRALVNGRYVTAENAGDAQLIANRQTIGLWESFDLFRLGPPCLDCIELKVERPRKITGPANTAIADGLFNTFDNGDGTIIGFSANTNTSRFAGSSMDNISLVSLGSALGPTPGYFDSCVAAIFSTIKTGNTVHGFYHAETDCDYDNNSQTYKSMMYAVSSNNGLTFQKGGRILTGQGPFVVGMPSGAGDATVLELGQYWYMFFLDWNGQVGKYGWTGVARAQAGQGGQPTAWLKWNNGSFSQPGLGGQTTLLGDIGHAISYDQTDAVMMLPRWDSQSRGLKLRFSADGVTWTRALNEPLLRLNSELWGYQPLTTDVGNSYELATYVSVVAPQGGVKWADAFYLVYTFVPPGADMDTRYIISRRVNVARSSQPVRPQVKVALTRYYSTSRGDHWVTTAAPTVTPFPGGADDFATEFDVGYVFTKRGPDMTELVDCYIPEWGKHMVGPGGCATGNYALRSLGFVYTSQKPNTVPLYRCFYAARNDHWVSNSPCEWGTTGVQTEFILGYAAN